MTEKRVVKVLPLDADHNMIEAAYMLIETMAKGTPERHKRIVAEVWKTMAQFAPRPKQTGLTKLQQRCHEAIFEFINDHGKAPTYDEIGAMLNKGKGDVFQIVHALKRRGVITLGENVRRSIAIVINPGEPLPPRIINRKGNKE